MEWGGSEGEETDFASLQSPVGKLVDLRTLVTAWSSTCSSLEDFMCPIEAHESWLRDKRVKLSGEGAMFRLEGGRNNTGAEFNKDLQRLLKSVVDYSVSPVT